ncbi:outer membrane beta-barrel protein [bacterium]|nr:outer membrane beta-barrel protein [candidate division CSSED10-310 bacterium]
MRTKFFITMSLIAVIMSSISIVQGQYHGGRYRYSDSANLVYGPGVVQITPYAGFLMGDEYDAAIDDAYAYGQIRQDDCAVAGIRVGFGLVQNVGLEFHYSQARSAFYGTTGNNFFESESKLSDVDIHTFMVNINFDFSDSTIVPYFTMGMGTTLYDVKSGTSDSEFTGSMGGGIKARIAPNIALRFDIRGYITQVQDSEYSYYWDGYYYDWESYSDAYLTTWESTLGLSFLL